MSRTHVRIETLCKGGLRWFMQEGAEMDYWITKSGMWIFATMVVIVMAGLLWGALHSDLEGLIGTLQNLF
ncbi:MAG: hypothetical protein OWT28_05240 [Firmicutes bacterium]|nr:hypothetical protein [Bacillota bacterium]